MNRLRQAGVSLPKSPTQARLTAKKMQDTVTNGSLAEDTKSIAAQMRRSRLANMQRTGADLQLAMPKIREPLGTLADKGVPFNISDDEELSKARMWSRAYYATHNLVPLLIDIYSRFPLTGLEFSCEDKSVEDFFSSLFFDDLDYEDFLPNSLAREYFISGEVTALGHFDEELGTWTSEEILNPDMIRVTKSPFVDEVRVQLLVKDMVEGLRNPTSSNESKSEQMQRMHDYEQLKEHYPELIAAATQDDGIDIDEGLWSRIVNRVSPWDNRGVPPLMRSFSTLLSEESLNAAQDAVADRLYAPFILATLGIENMGDGEPWIPSMSDLQDLRDDMQSALMADFKLMTHHMGLQIQNVFGREAMPRLDQDYDRIQAQLMQAWGIGQALIMGGTSAAGTYASSALNREVCELNMKDFQRKVIRHIRKRMEVVAEAQQFYAYEKKGSLRVPIWRKVRRYNPMTGRYEVVNAPKLLIPDVKFNSLNLRDESTERQFIMTLKQSGVPVSDKSMAINLPVDFDMELKRQSEETVDKLVAQAEAMSKAKQVIDEKNRRLPAERQLPYPPDLISYLNETLVLRQQLSAAEVAETQAKMLEDQAKAASPAGQVGALPPPLPPGQGSVPAPDSASLDPSPPMPEPEQEAPSFGPADLPSNYARPEVSDEMRAGAPRAAKKTGKRAAKRSGDTIRKKTWLETGPSSRGSRFDVDADTVERAVRRREVTDRHRVARVEDLVMDPAFYQMLNSPHERDIQADWPEIQNGGAPESKQLLDDLLQQYSDVTGREPIWA
ncbi:hypothetical protein ACT18_01020 [Mycolicibacter kumamotonensis]|uniref:Portal protein n=2 Tax=Mycolicibacter kumamotonensis TaxID=354243 RepID=A0A1B8SLB6_9MYCO|nr:hypothetical protein ACT18_01020 [Mycolicibacter kumamotonensis]